MPPDPRTSPVISVALSAGKLSVAPTSLPISTGDRVTWEVKDANGWKLRIRFNEPEMTAMDFDEDVISLKHGAARTIAGPPPSTPPRSPDPFRASYRISLEGSTGTVQSDVCYLAIERNPEPTDPTGHSPGHRPRGGKPSASSPGAAEGQDRSEEERRPAP